MGTVAITFRIMPDDPETDLEAIKLSVRRTLKDSLRDLQEQPVAFGLRAIVAVAVVSDTAGGSDALERSLASLPGVGSVEAVGVTLV